MLINYEVRDFMNGFHFGKLVIYYYYYYYYYYGNKAI